MLEIQDFETQDAKGGDFDRKFAADFLAIRRVAKCDQFGLVNTR